MEDIIIFLGIAFNLNLPLLTAWLLDHWLGDPVWLPHPVVAFGKAISFCEHRLNRGNARFLKGAVMSLVLVAGVYLLTLFLLRWAAHYSPGLLLTLQVLLIFYCLAGTTLVREVCGVFKAVDRSLEEGRKQVARIVGRDTSGLSAQEVRTAALETLAENLSDGVIAPLFWYMLLGVPGMLAYKMINTLDSMIGYRNERYRRFGCFAARLDDVANYIPARLTAFGGGFRQIPVAAFCGEIRQQACQSQFRLSGSGTCRNIGLPLRWSSQLFWRGSVETLYRRQ